jgi:hypothetical protein
VRPLDPLLNEKEAAPTTDLPAVEAAPTVEAAPAGSSVVAAPAASAVERPAGSPVVAMPAGSARRARCSLGCLHTSPRRRSSPRGREVASRGGEEGQQAAALRVAAAWEGGAGVGVGGGVGGRAVRVGEGERCGRESGAPAAGRRGGHLYR